jgi:hypothetical protein
MRNAKFRFCQNRLFRLDGFNYFWYERSILFPRSHCQSRWYMRKYVQCFASEPSVCGYNCATLFLGDINTEPGPADWGSLECETLKYSNESRGTRTWEWLRWRGPSTIVNDRPILSSEWMLSKDYNRKCSAEKSYWSWVSRGWRQDELTGGKPPVVK